MVLVAIAGGTSPTLGSSIVNAILASGNHSPVILSRQPSPSSSPTEQPQSKYGAPIRYVNYASVSSLTSALADVHTVISVLKIPSPSLMVTYHSNLLQAAQSAGARRFAPSEWEGGPLTKKTVDALAFKTEIWDLCARSGLECARFIPGAFMNYLGQGCGETVKEEGQAGLQDELMMEYIDMRKGRIVVPLNHQGLPARVVMTELRDIGRFVDAALSLGEGEWEAEMGMVGHELTMQDVVDMPEQATGRKFEVLPMTRDDLRRRQGEFDAQLANGFSLEAFMGKLAAQLMECDCYEERGNMLFDPVINRLCPQVKPITVEDYLNKYWKK